MPSRGRGGPEVDGKTRCSDEASLPTGPVRVYAWAVAGWLAPERALRGDLVMLRLPSRADAQTLFEYAWSAGGLEGIWVPLPPEASLACCEALVDDWLAGWRGEPSLQGASLVICRAGGFRMLGQIGLVDRGAGVVELSYGVAPHWRRRGLASAAARVAAEWLLETRAAREVELRIDKHKRDSMGVATKAGFRRAGAVASRVEISGEAYEDIRYVFEGTPHAPRTA